MTFDCDEVDDSLKLDFTSPDFILRNIDHKKQFSEFNILNEECRERMIRTSCDQVCFYVLCALKSYELNGEIPTIVVYGGRGVMGTYIIDALIACGCKPFLLIFARDPEIAKKWVSSGVRSTVSFDVKSKIDILIYSSNIMSFNQMCRDVGRNLKSTTFVISAVFNLQRKRIYNLYHTPNIVRTYVERKMSNRRKFSSAKLLLYRKDSLRNLFLIIENYMILLGIDPAIAREVLFDIFLGKNNVQHISQFTEETPNQRGNIKQLCLQVHNLPEYCEEENMTPKSCMSKMSPAHSSRDIFTPIKPCEETLLSHSPIPVSPTSQSSSNLPQIPLHAPKESKMLSAEIGKNMSLKGLSLAVQSLWQAYGTMFARELSKHVDSLHLPSLTAIRSSKVLNVKPKKVRQRYRSVAPVSLTRSNKIYSGYLDGNLLLRIFDSDKKAAPDMEVSEYMKEINSLSDSEEESDEEVDFDLFAALPSSLPDKYVVKSNKSRGGVPLISRLESDVVIGNKETPSFNIPKTIEKVVMGDNV